MAAIRLISLAAGLGPGFALPLAIAARSTPRESDGFLFATSFSLVMINVVVVAVESHSMAVVGSMLDQESISRRAWRRYTRQVALRGASTIAIVIPLLFLIYVLRDSRWAEFGPVVAVVAIAPVAGVFSSLASGILYAENRSSLPIWTQGLRSILPVAVLFLIDSPSMILLAMAFAAGEVCRAVLLHIVLRRVLRRREGNGPEFRHSGLFWQFGSAGTSQGNPIVDRLVLAGAGVGSITAYELADKISFAVYQIFYAGFLVPRSGGWGRALRNSPAAGMRMFWRHTLTAMALLLVSTLAVAALIAIALSIGVIPGYWEMGTQWAIIVLPSVTFSLGQMAAVRFLVALNAEKALLPATFVGFMLNVVADLVCYALFGAIGVVIATVVTRCVVCLIYFAVVRREQRRYHERGRDKFTTT